MVKELEEGEGMAPSKCVDLKVWSAMVLIDGVVILYCRGVGRDGYGSEEKREGACIYNFQHSFNQCI